MRILDLCNVIAGPHSVSYLARFGAEVVKVDPAQPLYDCWNTVIFGMTHMRGKKSVLADLKSPGGRDLFERLLRSVDVVVWNATDRQVKSLGLDAESLHKINPQAIFCQLDCFGGVRRGPRTDYLGYDDLVQAATGIMLRFGGSMQTPEEHAHVGTIDVMCGFGGATGIAAALYQKYRTGRIGRARTSLSALSGLAQIPFFYDYQHRSPFNEPSGPKAMGVDALHHLYRAADHWLMIVASEADLPKFSKVAGLEQLASVPNQDRGAFLFEAIKGASAKEWISRLGAADIGVAICDSIETIRSANCRISDASPGVDRGSYSFSTYPDHPSGHVVTQLDPYAVRTSTSKISALAPAEKYGASTGSVLSGLGYAEVEIEALMSEGVISKSWSREYLPS